jgi:hypothetical protein
MEKIHQSTTSTRAASSSRLSSAAATNIGTQSTLDVFDEFDRLCGLKPPETLSVALKQLSIDEEISFFVKAVHSADEFQRFWITHQATIPRLATLFRRFNICPATSVASESTFSVAGYLQRKQRASLSSSAMRYPIVLKNKTALSKLKQLTSSNNATG